MSTNEAELDAVEAAARATVAEGERLAAEAGAAREKTREWLAANNIGPETEEKFFASLPEAEKEKVRAEQEQFELEAKRDLEALEQDAAKASGQKPGGGPRRRNLA